MAEKQGKLYEWGVSICCLGGLIVIYNLTSARNTTWGLQLSILAVVLALLGLYMMRRGKA